MNDFVKFGHVNRMFYLDIAEDRSVTIFYNGAIHMASDPKRGYDYVTKDSLLGVMGIFLVKEIEPAIAEQV